MTFLHREREQLARLLPGFDEQLSRQEPANLEARGSSVIRDFAAAGGAGLLVPREHGGLGANATQATEVMRALGSRSASVAVGTTMHHYKIAWLAETLQPELRAPILERIARQRLLVASCGAEGQQTGGVFNPGIEVREHHSGVVVNGVKRPCSLVWDMGILSMLVRLPDGHPMSGEMAILLIDADHPHLHRHELWLNDALAASQTDEIRLKNVYVPPEAIIPIGADTAGKGASANLIWFEILITAAYLGAASGLVEAAANAPGAGIETVLDSIAMLEGAYLAVRGLAQRVDAGDRGQSALADGIICRVAAQRAIRESTSHALRVLGIHATPDNFRAAAAARALAFHPGGTRDGIPALLNYYNGGRLVLS
ncbi:acyl-CoA dehydrogenase family protein [Rhodococcus tibetensis]|uniref:Acyl-CoA/acyl-ACP dehydrogenase n=1 Tax=Rhodococcus tibetensis TaxID=2965064 RepID=A0ABT1QJ96_9NOCA|nr:acyl-CoA dehydrogenase family protein [Rhodococcus sp. FXJ9.536]MCQ4122361.1 acyl-CoA/acyl-ACP dehydrogenase [Rhodococcus sp. FXJ9.536]